MKKLLSVLVITVGLLAFSPNDLSAQANPGGVLVIKSGNWNWNACGVSYPAQNITVQYKNGTLHLVQAFFDLSSSCLIIPTSAQTGTVNIIVNGVIFPANYQFMPSGRLKVWYKDNSN